LVQIFLKKWWVESDFKAPNLPLSLWLKGSAVTITNEIRNEKYFNENNAYHATYMIISMNYQKIIGNLYIFIKT
jgi:hypothetical protein